MKKKLPKYCTQCGSKLVFKKHKVHGYDAYTGKTRARLMCTHATPERQLVSVTLPTHDKLDIYK